MYYLHVVCPASERVYSARRYSNNAACILHMYNCTTVHLLRMEKFCTGVCTRMYHFREEAN